MAYKYLSWLVVFVFAGLLRSTSSIILCDEGCKGAGDLGICEKPTNGTPLFLMGFFPCNTEDFRARGLTVAAQMAARAIRLNTSILQGYQLEISFNNSMCQRIAGVRAFIDQLREEATMGVTRHMIIGPGCSTGAITIAETAPFYSLTQISYTATTLTLSDTRRFPTFLRTISSDNASIPMIGAVVEEFGWEQIAIITLRNEVFINLTAVMIESYTEQGVNVISERLFFDAPSSDDQFQIFLDLMEEVKAHRKNLLYPTYLYITHYWWSQGWFLDPRSNCTVEQIVNATNSSIAVDHFPEPEINETDTPTDVGLTPNEFWKNFSANVSALNYPANETLRQAGYVYDAVWAAAFALDEVDAKLRGGVLPGRRSLMDFSYNATDINALIFNSAKGRTFTGVTGKVSFNEFGDRQPTGEIYQYLFPAVLDFPNNTLPTFEPFAVVNELKNRLIFVNNQSVDTVFPDGIPRAAEPLVTSLPLFVVMTILSGAGIIFAIACIVFNLACRAKRVVKLTSPYLNVITIIGGIFFYTAVILFGIDQNLASFTTVDRLCQARIWVVSVGFSLFFGPMLAKAFRVYYIFRSVKLKKKPLKDWILVLSVAVLVAIDVVFLIIVTVDEFRLTLNSVLLEREGGQIPLIIETCQSSASQVWLPVLLGYKAIYLLVGVLLAAQTYNVKIKELRDSKLILVSVFAVFVFCVVLVTIGFVVDDDPDALYGLLGSFILVLITGVMALLFVPRMVELWKDPSGEVTLSTVPDSHTQFNGSALSAEDTAKIADLRSEIAKLTQEIEMIKKQQPDSAKDSEILNKDRHSKGSAVNFEVLEMQESTNKTHRSDNGNRIVNSDISTGVRERKKGAEQTQ